MLCLKNLILKDRVTGRSSALNVLVWNIDANFSCFYWVIVCFIFDVCTDHFSVKSPLLWVLFDMVQLGTCMCLCEIHTNGCISLHFVPFAILLYFILIRPPGLISKMHQASCKCSFPNSYTDSAGKADGFSWLFRICARSNLSVPVSSWRSFALSHRFWLTFNNTSAVRNSWLLIDGARLEE